MSSRPNPADIQVVCVGYGRTGTFSIAKALEKLGFGPCYHPLMLIKEASGEIDIFGPWEKVKDENWSVADLDDLLRGYRSIMGFMAAVYAEKLYQAYPNAKFILTTRDPDSWEKSVKANILTMNDRLKAKPNKTKAEQSTSDTLDKDIVKKCKLETNGKEEMAAHNERMKKLIPPEKLLVYDIKEGWEPLVKFLGVPKPDGPIPHDNSSQKFEWSGK